MIDTKKLLEQMRNLCKLSDGHSFRVTASEVTPLLDELDRLTEEKDALRKDAERYRWLRSEGFDRPAVMWVMTVRDKIPVVHTDLDAAIDAAIRASKGEA